MVLSSQTPANLLRRRRAHVTTWCEQQELLGDEGAGRSDRQVPVPGDQAVAVLRSLISKLCEFASALLLVPVAGYEDVTQLEMVKSQSWKEEPKMQLPGFTAELVLGDRGRSHFASVGQPRSAQEEITPQLYISPWAPGQGGGAGGGGGPGVCACPICLRWRRGPWGPICVDTVIHYAPCT